jgi:pantothenate kinase
MSSSAAARRPRDRRGSVLLGIGLAGVPGAGKTTLGKCVVHRLERDFKLRGICISMDGFHLTRAQLDALPDPAEAHRLRGAPFTFDDARFAACLRRARQSVTKAGGTATFPGFDHAMGDPVPDQL